MPLVMTEKQFARWAKEVGDRLPKYGWIPAWKKIGAYLKRQQNIRLRAHKSPEGRSWKKKWTKPAPQIGDKAPMFLDDGSVIHQQIKSGREKKRARDFRKKRGPPLKQQKALIRTTGKFRVRSILDFLVTKATGRSIRMSKHKFEYGYTPGTQWIEKLQNGGYYFGQALPRREIVGMNANDVKEVEKIMADFVKRRLEKGR